MVTTKKLNPKYTFQQFNSEINELYNYLKSENYSNKEIRQFFSPITSKVGKKANTIQYVLLSILTLVFLIYLLTYIEYIYWHISAIGRIILIRLLPYFDWRQLKNKHCLIEKFNAAPNEDQAVFNCDLCEHIHKIDVYDTIDDDTLSQRYIELDVPLIITKGLENWPKNSSFIEDLLYDEVFYYSYPCKVSTNIHKGVSSTGRILERARLFPEFFLHFQNCELDAMKVFRRYTYRPDFLPAVYSPVLFNWLVWNRNYNTTKQKVVGLVEKLAVVGQLFGSTYFHLVPRHNCIEVCPLLDVKLNAGEALILTSLWDLEYTPHEGGENMAVILETRD